MSSVAGLGVLRPAASARTTLLLAAIGVLTAVVGARSVIAEVSGVHDRLILGMMIAGPLGAGISSLLRSRTAEPTRPVWGMLSLCLFASAAATTAAGATALDPVATPGPLASVLWLVAYAAGLRAFTLLVLIRLGRLHRTTWLDGLLGGLVIQALLTYVLLLPSDIAVEQASLNALLFPCGDVLLVALFLAAAAQTGWRLKGWTPFIAGAVLISIADFAVSARALGAQHEAYELAVLGWPLGYACLGYGAWTRGPLSDARPNGRPGVPVTFGAIAAALLGLAALSDARVAGVTASLALLGLAGVLTRFGVTLRENETMMRAAHDQALTDVLTRLPNRRRLERDLESAVAVATPANPTALALFDLDGFKGYNDTFGHQAGDALLEAVGCRLADAVAPRGQAYRLGGDEFCVLVRMGGDGAERFMAAAAAALASDVTGFSVAPSYGCAIIPLEATDSATALSLADRRMYVHKASKPDGPNRVELVAPPWLGAEGE